MNASFSSVPPQGYHFLPVSPCRAIDTRTINATGIPGNTSRDVTFGGCGMPAGAVAVALNVTVAPRGTLSYLTIWPAGQAQPTVSTLNSVDGRIKANAAIVGTGTNSAVSVFVTQTADVIVDVNGYFVPLGTPNALAFYQRAPCRVVDTRDTGGLIGASETRRIAGGGCLPAQAGAYSLNVTAVPQSALGFLTMWPDGTTQPLVSTLNALTGTVTANAAVLQAGTAGAINAYVTNPSHLAVDLNGYFAPPGGVGAMSFYPIRPCRISDTRDPIGPFGGPRIEGQQTRDYTIPSSACSIPATATAYVLNATVVPPASFGFLTLYPGGQALPLVSTLNAVDGSLTSNAAIVAAGPAGVVRAYASNPAHLILDISGYFAP